MRVTRTVLSNPLRIVLVLLMFAGVILMFSVAISKPVEAWLHPGPTVQYPIEGGEWIYGFWNIMARSWYYNEEVIHRSTVEVNGNRLRSICTRPGEVSRAEVGAINLPWWNDAYYYAPHCND